MSRNRGTMQFWLAWCTQPAFDPNLAKGSERVLLSAREVTNVGL